MATITVVVTQEDIEQGEKCDCEGCMIAIAVRRLLMLDLTIEVAPDVRMVHLMPHSIDIDNVTISLPEDAAQLAMLWDNEQEVAPFTFPLDIPDELLRQDVAR